MLDLRRSGSARASRSASRKGSALSSESTTFSTPATPSTIESHRVRSTRSRGGDGTSSTLVDATSQIEWTYGDFTLGTEVAETSPWDLRFQRFHISTGKTGNQIAIITGASFASVTTAPTAGWIAEGWYDYNGETHVLTPKPIVYAVKLHGGSAIKLDPEVLRQRRHGREAAVAAVIPDPRTSKLWRYIAIALFAMCAVVACTGV